MKNSGVERNGCPSDFKSLTTFSSISFVIIFNDYANGILGSFTFSFFLITKLDVFLHLIYYVSNSHIHVYKELISFELNSVYVSFYVIGIGILHEINEEADDSKFLFQIVVDELGSISLGISSGTSNVYIDLKDTYFY